MRAPRHLYEPWQLDLLRMKYHSVWGSANSVRAPSSAGSLDPAGETRVCAPYVCHERREEVDVGEIP
jgi:hypothetical protein